MRSLRDQRLARLICVSALFFLVACEGSTLASDVPHDVERDAEKFIAELRAKQWHTAAKLCVIDKHALRRLNLSVSEDEAVVLREIAALFQRVYENLPPGEIYGVELDAQQNGDSTLARVVYLHDDLDAFYMRKVGNRWRYTFE